tara:strand:+ start:2334 stop:2438 length:105 start_codon:yes stop_codon:yes gene_type:complete
MFLALCLLLIVVGFECLDFSSEKRFMESQITNVS